MDTKFVKASIEEVLRICRAEGIVVGSYTLMAKLEQSVSILIGEPTEPGQVQDLEVSVKAGAMVFKSAVIKGEEPVRVNGVNDYLRVRAKEDGFAGKIQPPIDVTPANLCKGVFLTPKTRPGVPVNKELENAGARVGVTCMFHEKEPFKYRATVTATGAKRAFRTKASLAHWLINRKIWKEKNVRELGKASSTALRQIASSCTDYTARGGDRGIRALSKAEVHEMILQDWETLEVACV